MLRQTMYYLIVVTLLLSTVTWAYDPEICPTGTSPPILHPSWHRVPPRFEIVTELSQNNELLELSQAFSPRRDAIALTGRGAATIQTYWNFETNERIIVARPAIAGGQLAPICAVQNLTNTSPTSLVDPGDFLIKPSALLGFDGRNHNNTNWGINLVGTATIRGIPALVFQSCFMVDDIQATVNATYFVSDPNPAVFSPFGRGNPSFLLRIDVKSKNANGNRAEYTYHVQRYIPNPGQREEQQALETPAGVYCPNRSRGLHVPANVPSRVSANSETYLPNFNSTIISTHRLFDTEFEFTRADVWYLDRDTGAPSHYTEIHDYATGLSYRYAHRDRRCTVANITVRGNEAVPVEGAPELVQISNPEHFFLLDDIEYQYTGEKRCRDRVWCHVWIGEKPGRNNFTEHREWYWAISINNEPLTQWIPIKFVVKQYNSGLLVSTVEISVFDYRRRPFTIFEVDYALADCYRALGPAKKYNIGVLSFRINNEKRFPVFTNLNYLRAHIWETLSFAMFIRPIRISNLLVDQDGDDILVTFTLLDAPPTTGPVEVPFKEKSLDTLIERLDAAINSNDLIFRARTGTRQVILRARPNSLNVPHQSTEKQSMKSGPRITGLWLGLIITGIVVGAVGGFIVLAMMTKK